MLLSMKSQAGSGFFETIPPRSAYKPYHQTNGFNMSSLKRNFFSCLWILGILTLPVSAQTTEYSIAPESNIYVDGTSNQTPEWRVYATEVHGLVILNEAGNVDSVRVVVPSKMMKSRKSPIMDRGMYGALKANAHDEIVYELSSASELEVASDSTFSLNVTGNLTIADATNEILVPIESVKKEDGKIHFHGSHTMLMTDYGLKPPSLMFGAYRTGDELVITFEIIAVPAE